MQKRTEVLVYLGLGSNLGDRLSNLEGALRALRELSGFELLHVSDWIETSAVGGPVGQGDFLNGALAARTSLAPDELLDELQAIEHAFGRERRVHHGPRTLDLDLLLYGEEVIESPRLRVPHPELEQRCFVLEPLAQLAPELRLARSGLSVRERLAQLAGPAQKQELHVHGH